MASTTFVYSDLENKETIRLLKILPHKGHHGIACTLKHFHEGDTSRPKYNALSYHWGTINRNAPPRHILIRYEEDQDFHEKGIHDSLWEFLAEMHISEARTEAHYWIDALCLNQDSEEEKKHQVPRMDTIYSEASRTIAWLGHPEPLDKIDEQLLNKLPDWIEEHRAEVEKLLGGFTADSYKPTNFHTLPNKFDSKVVRDLRPGILDRSMDIIFSQSYWMRVWVIQEMALAKEVEILCGSKSFNFDDFLVAYKGYVTYFREASIRPAAVEARMLLPDAGVSFDDIIQWGETCQSSMCVDKVYGLLGLLKRSEKASYAKSLDADYKKTAAQLFWELVFSLELYRQGRKSTQGDLFANNRLRTRTLCKSLMESCVLDGDGLKEFATSSASSVSSTTPETHEALAEAETRPMAEAKARTLALLCMESLPIYQAIGELLGWKFLRIFHNTDFGYREWVQRWGSQLPAYPQAPEKRGISEDEILDALKLGMEVYQDGDPTGTLTGGWHCLRDQDSSAWVSNTNTIMLTGLYGSIKSHADSEYVKQRICMLYSTDNCGWFQQDPSDELRGERRWASESLLVLTIKQMGWKLGFKPIPELLSDGNWAPDIDEKTKIGELFVRF